jgi:hypothetical protein
MFKRFVRAVAHMAFVAAAVLMGGAGSSAAPEEAPAGAREFAEQFFPQIVEEIVFTDQPGDWGFREAEGVITFSELYPIYSLHAEFLSGNTTALIDDRAPIWVAVVFQDGRPVNAIGARQTGDGMFGLDAFGYPPELPHGLLHLKEDEIVLRIPLSDEYYIYSEADGTLTKIALADGGYTPGSPQTVEEFRRVLAERYAGGNEREKRIGLAYAVISAAVLFGLFWAARICFRGKTKALR